MASLNAVNLAPTPSDREDALQRRSKEKGRVRNCQRKGQALSQLTHTPGISALQALASARYSAQNPRTGTLTSFGDHLWAAKIQGRWHHSSPEPKAAWTSTSPGVLGTELEETGVPHDPSQALVRLPRGFIGDP